MRRAAKRAPGVGRRASALSTLILVLAASAATAQRRPAPAPAAVATDADVDAARDVVAAFVAAEARGESNDTLLAPGADFIMTGVVVHARPRLAGLNGPGEAAIETSNCSLAGAFAWVVISYAFQGRTHDLDERARATFVLEKQRAGWRIRHVHSSMVERW